MHDGRRHGPRTTPSIHSRRVGGLRGDARASGADYGAPTIIRGRVSLLSDAARKIHARGEERTKEDRDRRGRRRGFCVDIGVRSSGRMGAAFFVSSSSRRLVEFVKCAERRARGIRDTGTKRHANRAASIASHPSTKIQRASIEQSDWQLVTLIGRLVCPPSGNQVSLLRFSAENSDSLVARTDAFHSRRTVRGKETVRKETARFRDSGLRHSQADERTREIK